MKISFTNRRISAGPIAVLHHLYYYTVQYGLSVKQYTGKHQDYWAKELPALLRQAQDKPDVLKRIITQLERLGSGAEDRLYRRRNQLKGGRWEEKEIVLNAELLAVLASLPELLLARLFGYLTDSSGLPESLRVVDLKLEKEQAGEDGDFVEPDLLLLGGEYLLMVEMKTRGGRTSSRSYPPTQVLNYMRLIVECRNAPDSMLPRRFAHLILVPTPDYEWLQRHESWVTGDKRSSDGRVNIDKDKCIKFGNAYVKKHRKQFYQAIADTPIYYRSWDEMAQGYSAIIEDFANDRHYSHWQKIGSELVELADRAGKYK